MDTQNPVGDVISGEIYSHIEGYFAYCLKARQDSRHVRQKRSHLRKFVRETGATSLRDVTLETLVANMAEMRDQKRSARTANWRRQIVITWLNWCVTTGRIEKHNTHLAPRYDESGDQRRVRRALTDSECVSLLEVADKRGRGLWYRLALECGLRRGELTRLRWADVDLDVGVLNIRGSKAKRLDTVPMLGDTAAQLLAARPATITLETTLFSPAVGDAERRADFAAAGIAEVDERGRVADFHALRTTLGTRLARKGIAPQIAQKIMRHRSYTTTLAYYTDLQMRDMRAALVGAHGSGEQHLDGWLSTCPLPLSDPHKRAIEGLLAAG